MNVLVICVARYNSHQLWSSLGVILERGHTFEVVSTKLEIRDEVTGRPYTLARTVYEVGSMDGFGALVLLSGNPQDTEAYWSNTRVLDLISEADEENLLIAAICGSVSTLAHIVKGRRVSSFPLTRNREKLEQAGALLQPVTITIDNNLVTAEHEMATQMWAEEFCNVMEGKPQQYHFKDSGFVPKGRERKPIPELERIKEILRISKVP